MIKENQCGRLPISVLTAFAMILILIRPWSCSTVIAKEPNSYPKWSKIELTFTGPDSLARGGSNPFSVALHVLFTSPTGRITRVPGFFDGNGTGQQDGRQWKVRFSADEKGLWTYLTECDDHLLDGKIGSFLVGDIRNDAQGLWKWGRLEYQGTTDNRIRYLKFRDGPYWLKAGCDDPENFLGRYRNFGTQKQRIAAIDYLAKHGINSMYIMSHNLDGDDKDVWPWWGQSSKEAKQNSRQGNVRFDISKLEQWRQVFEHMQTRGVVLYLILEDDSAWSGYDHERYWREMIARFGYLPGLVFNLGEEHNENYQLNKGLELAKAFKEQNPYHHALGIHNINRANDTYVDSPYVDLTAIQTGSPGTRRGLKNAIEWIQRCIQRKKRVLVTNFDEGRPELDRRAWWSAYLGGGVWEAHVTEPYDQSYSAWETTWKQLGGTRHFMESIPFWKMEPRNDLVTKGQAFCLAQTGQVYAFYLPNGGSATVRLAPGLKYDVAWWNPENDRHGIFQNRSVITGGEQTLHAPGAGDWTVRIASQK